MNLLLKSVLTAASFFLTTSPLLAAECLVTTFGPLSLATSTTPSDDTDSSLDFQSPVSQVGMAPIGLRICMTNLFGKSDTPVAVELFDAHNARSAEFTTVMWLAPGEGKCLHPRLPRSSLSLKNAKTVIAAVTVQTDAANRSPLVISAVTPGPSPIALLLPAIQSAREPAGPHPVPDPV